MQCSIRNKSHKAECKFRQSTSSSPLSAWISSKSSAWCHSTAVNSRWSCRKKTRRGSAAQKLDLKNSPALLLPLLEPYNQMNVLQTHISKKSTGLEHSYDPGEQTESNLKEYTLFALVCFPPREASWLSEEDMDFLNHNYLSARTSYDYTFNFWNDYLGLSTLVTKNNKHSVPQSPNSITESLKATLGLDDSPPCPCGHLDSCCCPPPAPISILDLKERFSILSPFQDQNQSTGGLLSSSHEREMGIGGSFAGFDLFGVERKMRKPAARNKQEPKICVFCRNNGAPEEVYGSHVLKTPDGRVVCPILRAYTCPLCSANGDNAHTIKYCPLSKDQPAQRVLKGGRAVGGKRVKIF
uniref:Nanos homolog 1 n=2 Tax=Cyprinus carpio TaxID=7962 RepID=A0A9J7Y4P3_CYPCA